MTKHLVFSISLMVAVLRQADADDVRPRLDPQQKQPCVELRLKPGDRFVDVAFNSDGSLVAACHDFQIVVFDVKSGAVVQVLDKGASKLLFSSKDPTLFVSGDNAGNIQAWRVGQVERLRELRGNRLAISSVALDTSDTRLVSTSLRELRVWDFQSGKQLHSEVAEKAELLGSSFSSDASLVAYCEADRVHVVRLSDWTRLSTHQLPKGRTTRGRESFHRNWGTTTAFEKHDECIVVAGWMETRQKYDGYKEIDDFHYGLIWNIDRSDRNGAITMRQTAGEPGRQKDSRPIPAIAAHGDGRSFVAFELTGRGDSVRSSLERIDVLDVLTGQRVWSINGPRNISGEIRGIAYSPKANMIGVCINDCLRLWQVDVDRPAPATPKPMPLPKPIPNPIQLPARPAPSVELSPPKA